jgi:hypothetical protein
MMRTRFKYCEDPLPFPPGQSPFHIKGEFYRQMGEWLAFHDGKCEGGVTRALERAGLTAFAGQAFLASSYYDVLPLPRMVMAVAEARGKDVRDLTANMAKGAVEGQMKGVYAAFLSKLTPESFCQRFPQVVQYFYDFGSLAVTPTESGAALLRSGLPQCISEWWCLATAPFIEIPLRAAGAPDVAVHFRTESRGLDRGLEVCDAIGEVRWTV